MMMMTHLLPGGRRQEQMATNMPPTKHVKARKARKVLLTVSALVGASLLASSNEVAAGPFRLLTKLRQLCEDRFYPHADTPYGLWNELYPPDTNYYNLQGAEDDRANNVAFVLTLLDCPERSLAELPGVPEGAPDNDIFYDHVSLLKWHICDECETITVGGRTYNATNYAFINGNGIICMNHEGVMYDRIKVLQELGFYVKIIGSPVKTSEITDDYLRTNIESDVGLKDLIRLHAYNLTRHPLAVMVDYDTLILQELNGVFDEFDASGASAAITMNYNGAGGKEGINTGFVILRPSETELTRIINTFKHTPYNPTTGWASTGIGGFPGSMGTSGLLQYYYEYIADAPPLVLNSCLSQVNNPYVQAGFAVCRQNNACATCSNYATAYVAKMSNMCGRPYDCPDLAWLPFMCENLHRTWFEKRLDYMYNHLLNGPISGLTGTFEVDTYKGFCSGPGRSGYEKIIVDNPDGATPGSVVGTTFDLVVMGTESCGATTCPAGEYLAEDCTCVSDECDACPDGTRCQRANPTKGTPPICIDCMCGFCDYNKNNCCEYNHANTCRAATNKMECFLQNAYFPGSPGVFDTCSVFVEVGASAAPTGCGCQPSASTPCHYDRSQASQDDKCFVVRADELVSTKHMHMTTDALATAVKCAECVATHCGGGSCIHGSGQESVSAMQQCLGQNVGASDPCRENCASDCLKIDNAGGSIPADNGYGYDEGVGLTLT